MNIVEAAQALGVTTKTVRKLINAGDIEARRPRKEKEDHKPIVDENGVVHIEL